MLLVYFRAMLRSLHCEIDIKDIMHEAVGNLHSSEKGHQPISGELTDNPKLLGKELTNSTEKI